MSEETCVYRRQRRVRLHDHAVRADRVQQIVAVQGADFVSHANRAPREHCQQKILRLAAHKDVGERPDAHSAGKPAAVEKICPAFLAEAVFAGPQAGQIGQRQTLHEVPRRSHAVLQIQTLLARGCRHITQKRVRVIQVKAGHGV